MKNSNTYGDFTGKSLIARKRSTGYLAALLSVFSLNAFAQEGYTEWESSYSQQFDIADWKSSNPTPYTNYFKSDEIGCLSNWFINLGPLGVRTLMHDRNWNMSAALEIAPAFLKDENGKVKHSFEILEVKPGSPSENRLQNGDLIIGFNGKDLESSQCAMLDQEFTSRDIRGLEIHAGKVIDVAEGIGEITVTVLRIPEEDKEGLVNACVGIRNWNSLETVSLAGDGAETTLDVTLGNAEILQIHHAASSKLNSVAANDLTLVNIDTGLETPLSNSITGGTYFYNTQFEIPEGNWRLTGSLTNNNTTSKDIEFRTFEPVALPAVLEQYEHDIIIPLPKIGSFGDNFDPAGEKARNYSKILAKRLAIQQEENGSWSPGGSYASDSFTTSICGLALLSTDDPQYDDNIRKAAYAVAVESDPDKWSYSRGLWLMFLSEYYLRTGDEGIIEPLKLHIARARQNIHTDYTAGHSSSPGYGGSGYIGGGSVIACGLAAASHTPAASEEDKYVLDKMLERIQQLAPSGKVPYGRNGSPTTTEYSPGQGGGCQTGGYLAASLIRGGSTLFTENAKLRYGTGPWGSAEVGHATQTLHFFWGMMSSAISSPEGLTGSMDAYSWKFTTLREFDGTVNRNNYRTEYHNGDGAIGKGPFWRTAAYLTIMNAYKKNMAMTGKPEYMAAETRDLDVVYSMDTKLRSFTERNWVLIESALGAQAPQSVTDAIKGLQALPADTGLGDAVRAYIQQWGPSLANDILALESIPSGNDKVMLAELAMGTSFEASISGYTDENGEVDVNKQTLKVTPISMIQATGWGENDFQTGLFSVSNVSATITDPSGLYLTDPVTVQFTQDNAGTEEILSTGLTHVFDFPEGTETEFDVRVNYTVGGVAIDYTAAMPVPGLTARKYVPVLPIIKVSGTASEDYNSIWNGRLKLDTGRTFLCEQENQPYIIAGSPCELYISPVGHHAHTLREVVKLDPDYAFANPDSYTVDNSNYVGDITHLFDGDATTKIDTSEGETYLFDYNYINPVEVSALISHTSTGKSPYITVEAMVDGQWKTVSPTRETPEKFVITQFVPVTSDQFRITMRTATKSPPSICDLSLRLHNGGEGKAFAKEPQFSSEILPEITTYENATFSKSIAGYATDYDNDALTFVKESGPDWVTIAEDGTVTVSPLAADVGSHQVTVKVFDGVDGYDTATFNVVIKADQPFLHWTFNDGAATDISGNNNHGTVTGAIATTDGDNGAFYFNGDTDRIEKTLTSSTWPEYTVSLWMKAGSVGQDNYSSIFNNDSGGADFQIAVDGNNPGELKFSGSSTASIATVTTDWMHITAVCDGTETKLYKDGVYVATAASVDNVFGRIAVGVNRNDNKGFEGLIDEVIVYDRAFSDAEVTALISTDVMNSSVLAVDDAATVDEDNAVAINVLTNDSDADGDTMTIVEVSQPANGFAVLDGGAVTYTPATNWHGSDSFTYTVSDGVVETTATVSVTVNSINDLPDTLSDVAQTVEDTPVAIDVLVNDFDTDGDTLTIQSLVQPSFGSVVQNGNSVTYTPDADANGIDSFTYIISDGQDSSTGTVIVSVDAVNDQPIAAADSISTDEDTAVVISVLGNDSDVDTEDTLVVSSVTQGSIGTVTNNGTSVTYTPNDNENGVDSFTYTISDGNGETATASVSVTVNSVEDAPEANTDIVATEINTSVTFDVLANDVEPEGEAMTFTGYTQPSRGVVSFDGSVATYQPDTDFNGQDTFTYTVEDEGGNSSVGTVIVNVSLIFETFQSVDTSVDKAVAPIALTWGDVEQGGFGSISVADSTVNAQLDATNVNVNKGTSEYSMVDNVLQITAPVPYTDDSVNDPFDDNLNGKLADSGAILNFGTDADIKLREIEFDYQKVSQTYYRVLVRYTTDNGTTWQNIDQNGDGIEDSNDAVIVNVGNSDETVHRYSMASPVSLTGVDAIRIITWSNTTNYSMSVIVDNLRVDGLLSALAVDDVVVVDEDSSVDLAVMDNDNVSGFNVASVSQAENGTVTTDGTLVSYTPESDFYGNDVFTYSITDGLGVTDAATVYVTVNPVNDAAPVAADDIVDIDVEQTAVISILTNDSDIDGDTLTVASITQGANGSVSTDGTTITYIPAAGFTGTDSFTYTVGDGELVSNVATVTVEVYDFVSESLTSVDTASGPYVISAGSSVALPFLTVEAGTHGSLSVVNSIDNLQLGDSEVSVNPNESNYSITENALQITAPVPYTDDAVLDPFDDNLTSKLADSGLVLNFGTDANVSLTNVEFDYQKISAKYYRVLVRYTTDNGLTWSNLDRNGDGQEDAADVVTVDYGNTDELVHHYSLISPVSLTGVDALRIVVWSNTDDHPQVVLVDNIDIDHNYVPIAVDDAWTTQEGITVTADVLANDSDYNLDTLNIDSVSQGANGSVVINGSAIEYTSNNGFTGTDSFTYVVNDGNGLTGSATVTVTVDPYDAPPEAPTSLATSIDRSSINLDWDDNTEPDLASYTLYRSTTSGSGYAALAVGLTSSDYIDSSAVNGTSYYYTVTAVDSNGSESVSSSEVAAMVTGLNDPALVDGSFEDQVLASGGTSDDINSWFDGVGYTFTQNDGASTHPDTPYGDNWTEFGQRRWMYQQVGTYKGSMDIETSFLMGARSDSNPSPVVVGVFVGGNPALTADVNSQFYLADLGNAANPLVGTVGAALADSSGEIAPFSGKALATSEQSVTLSIGAGYTVGDPIWVMFYCPLTGSGRMLIDNIQVSEVIPNTAPVFAADPIDKLDATEDATYTGQSLAGEATDADSDPLAYTKVSGPAWLTIAADGTLSGTPANEDVGANVFTVQADDGNGGTDTATLNVTVINTNDAPVAAADAEVTDEDVAVVVSVLTNDSDIEGDTLSVTAVSQGTNGAVSTNGTTVTYTPTANFNGADSFTYTVSDGNGGSDTATVSVTVNAVNDAPIAAADSTSVNEDASVAVTVLANDTDAENDTLSIASVTQGTNGSVSINGTTVTYTPTSNFYGADSFTYTVSDGNGGSDTATVTVTVNAVNDAPVASNTAGSLAENGNGGDAVASVSATDPDAETSLSYTITSGNGAGLFAIDANGNVTATDALDFESASQHVLSVEVSDGSLTDTATVTVDVTDVNEAPVASDTAGSLAENGLASAAVTSVSATDVDAGDSLGYAITSGNGSGLFAIDANGNITTTGGLDFESASQHVLTVTVTDSGSLTDTATVTVDVTDVNEAPVASDTGGSLAENGSASAAVASVTATDVDAGDSLSYAITSGNGSGLFVIDANGNITTTGGLDFESASQHVLTVTVTDSGSLTDTATVTVDVTDVNEAPVASDTGGSLVENGSASAAVASVTATDVDAGDSLGYAITSGNGSSLFAIDANGNITTTGGLDFESANQHVLTVTVTDSGSLIDTATVTVDVTDANETPVANNAAGNVSEDASVGTTVASVSASDVDSGASLSYAITAGNTGTAFSIDSNGNVKTAAALDFETTPNYSLTVTVSDGSLSDTAIVSITVNDVAEVTAPVIATGAASNLGQETADIAYSVTDEGGEAPTVTVYYGETDGGQSTGAWDSNVAVGVQSVGSYVESLTALTEGTEYFFTVHATNSAGEVWGSSSSFTSEADTSPKMVRTTVSAVSSTTWVSVDLGQNYNSAVIVATPIYADSTQVPIVTRIRNVSGSSFELKLDRADGLTAETTADVSVIAVEEGVYTLAADGVQMEAVKYTSTITANNSSWTGEAQSYQNSYTTPVVVGQVMSDNDSNWSVFWSMGSSRTNPATASNINVGKHVGEDPNVVRANETVGYIVIEQGAGVINGVAYEAALGADIVRGFDNSSNPYTYSLSGNLASASAAALSVSGMDGADGSWAVLSGANPLTPSTLSLHASEDQMNDSELKHSTTQVGYIIFE